MDIQFAKYQGTGNDFVLADNRQGQYDGLTTEQIKKICDRRFGIGADGMILLNNREGYDFEQKYFNANGKIGSMCGNGGRCLIKFAYDCGIHASQYHFLAYDGVHEGIITPEGIIKLKMQDVNKITNYHNDYILDTGSPHYIKLVSNVMDIDVVKRGKEIRHLEEFDEEGINVNFVEQLEDDEKIIVRTFERGVEGETFSCGTGVTASALICFHNDNGFNEVNVKTLGGYLFVEFDRIADERFENIWLCGPAEKVFEGTISIA
ncbi:MAG: diaminopimelate epimerase [Chitinophagaceae bacterium]|nr:diaminopimelate epimerase [Chitinophagaceae bacterium]MCB0739774.1 diaminopimelate epimerase [Chitinophagaceae bacterium]HQU55809.1 diaminopimelate epimerase [Chitinophagaceae bacterium]